MAAPGQRESRAPGAGARGLSGGTVGGGPHIPHSCTTPVRRPVPAITDLYPRHAMLKYRQRKASDHPDAPGRPSAEASPARVEHPRQAGSRVLDALAPQHLEWRFFGASFRADVTDGPADISGRSAAW